MIVGRHLAPQATHRHALLQPSLPPSADRAPVPPHCTPAKPSPTPAPAPAPAPHAPLTPFAQCAPRPRDPQAPRAPRPPCPHALHVPHAHTIPSWRDGVFLGVVEPGPAAHRRIGLPRSSTRSLHHARGFYQHCQDPQMNHARATKERVGRC